MELQMRNACLFDNETKEFVQIQYLCDADSTFNVEESLYSHHCLKDIGNASDKTFMAHGMFPVSIRYEKNGSLCRERENHISDYFLLGKNNIYTPCNEGVKLVCRMVHLQERRKKQKASRPGQKSYKN